MVNAAKNSDVGNRAGRRIARHLLPFLLILYIINYLDRVNVGYASLEMSRDLGFSDRAFGLGAGILWIGYFLLEIPGALIVERWSARAWFGLILAVWGILTIRVGFIHTAGQFYVARFLLGVVEGGFFPGIVVYLTHWFRYEDRAKALAMFMAAVPISNIIGSPLAGFLLGVRWHGFEGWRWMFIIEGIPAVCLGLITPFYLTDWPRQASWLQPDECEWISGELEQERQAKKARRSYTIIEALGRREVIVLSLVGFFSLIGLGGFNIWFPTILKRSTGVSDLMTGLLGSLPYIVGLAAMLWNGWHSDITGERRWHTAVPLFLVASFFMLAIVSGPRTWITVVALTVVGAGLTAYLPTFWTMSTGLLSDSAAAASIGLINSVGNLGGFVGPFVLGYLSTRTGSFTGGLIFLLMGAFLSGVLVISLKDRRTRFSVSDEKRLRKKNEAGGLT